LAAMKITHNCWRHERKLSICATLELESRSQFDPGKDPKKEKKEKERIIARVKSGRRPPRGTNAKGEKEKRGPH